MQVCSAAGLTMRLQPGRGVLCRSGTQEPGRVYKGCFAFCGKRSSVPCVALSLFLRKNCTCGWFRRHFYGRCLPECLGELLTTGTLQAGRLSPLGNVSRAESLGRDN